MDMNNMNEIPKPKEEPKEAELTENSIQSKYNNKKNKPTSSFYLAEVWRRHQIKAP